MYGKKRPRFTLAAFLCVALTALAGCNTTAGIGRDVTAAGGAITGEANQAKTY
ncbi:MAG: entericidin [Alphaproteobacteria bacterium HGW-Alphaproteobacteria-6]|nr:MAG: entericidin [Alphaproteobacteria bacterium HGW-Alphaproteobacteria-6]